MDGTSSCVGISSQPPFFSQKTNFFHKNKKVLASGGNKSVNSCKHMQAMQLWLAQMVLDSSVKFF